MTMPGDHRLYFPFFRETICFMRSTTTSVLSRYTTGLYARHTMLNILLCQGPRSDWCDQAAGWPLPLHRQVQGGFNSCLPFLHCANMPGCHLGLELRWFRDGFSPRCRCWPEQHLQGFHFSISVFCFWIENYQWYYFSAASALRQSLTGSTTIPSTQRGTF